MKDTTLQLLRIMKNEMVMNSGTTNIYARELRETNLYSCCVEDRFGGYCFRFWLLG